MTRNEILAGMASAGAAFADSPAYSPDAVVMAKEAKRAFSDIIGPTNDFFARKRAVTRDAAMMTFALAALTTRNTRRFAMP